MNIYNYLGRPWERGAFDCWHLVREFYARELAIGLPVVEIDAENFKAVMREFKDSPIFGLFVRVDDLADYDVVAMSRGASHVGHVGVYLSRFDSVLHNAHGVGVINEPLERIAHKGAIAGYYRHRDVWLGSFENG